ncbi:hypothetical protein [Coleofasciculus sp.]|uniref:hypothetical protein n=1 Tax=Coleofasciculus sp. TaxID=3100458 RepID=UPI0039FA50FD
MKKHEVRAMLSRSIILKLDELREIYDGAPRSVVLAIAIRKLFELEQGQKEAAPTREAA